MILIINQHKGDYQELLDHLANYAHVVDPKYFTMVMVVDQELAVDSKIQLEHTFTKYGVQFVFNDKNLGLSQSRSIAVKEFHKSNPDLNKYSQIIFGCTNSKWLINLDGELHNMLKDQQTPTLLSVSYKNDIEEREESLFHKDVVSFTEYINCVFKPDFTLMIPYKYWDAIKCIDEEKYYPEEIILENVFRKYSKNSYDWVFEVIHKPLQLCWYNDKGLSKTFNRQFMIDNSKGFSLRAKTLLTDFLKNELPLTYYRLKYYMYDYVTLGSDKDHIFRGTVLEDLYWRILRNWLEVDGHDHKIKFLEDNNE